MYKSSICEANSSLSDDTSSTVVGRDPSFNLSVNVDAVAGFVRVPLTCLEGIWRKATELLRTDGAIVSAPVLGRMQNMY